MRSKRLLRILAALILVLAATAAIHFDIKHYLTLEYFQLQRIALTQLHVQQPLAFAAAYFALYVLITSLSIPGAAVLTVAAGALFGFTNGILLVSFASAIGATFAFLSARFLLREWVERTFGERLRTINTGIARDGVRYLVTLRLIPAFPFFVINLVFGVTTLPTRVFYAASQLGMLPVTAVFVNAGTRLAEIHSLRDVLAPPILISLLALALLPWLLRTAHTHWQHFILMRAFPKPRRFDANLVVIGAGAAGLVSAYIAAAVRAKVILIERSHMGGDCLNTGCVPSKTLIRAAKHVYHARHAELFGLRAHETEFDFAAVMTHVRAVIAAIAPNDSAARYATLGVNCISGDARIITPYQVRVGEHEITTRSIVIATGATPSIPNLPGLNEVAYVTSDTIWALQSLPRRLLVLGGGPISCELGQAFARLGSQVTIIARGPQLLPKEDPEVGEFIAQKLRAEGITILTQCAALRASGDAAGYRLHCEQFHTAGHADGSRAPRTLEFDCLLLAVGRTPNVTGLGLETLGIELTPNGALTVNAALQARYPNIYACGDVTGRMQFTHAAAHQAWYASINALFNPLKQFTVDERVIPYCTFTDPEIARIGLNESAARASNIRYEKYQYPIAELDRARTDAATDGTLIVLTPPGSDRILGATIIAERAGDMIAELALAMCHGLGLKKVLNTVHAYPTWMEANRFVAGAWRLAHQPSRLLRLVERFHHWRRG